MHGIYSDFGSAVLRAESDAALKQIADALGANREWRVRLEGHPDTIGTAERNQTLSEARAAAVKDALVTRYAIAAARLSTAGHGAADQRRQTTHSWALLVAGAPIAGDAQQPDPNDKTPVHELTLEKHPEITNGRIAMVDGETDAQGVRMVVSKLSIPQPVGASECGAAAAVPWAVTCHQ